MNSLTHSLGQGTSTLQILFIKSFAALILFCFIHINALSKIAETKLLPIHIIKGLCGVLGNWALIKSLQFLPIVEVSALSLTSAFITSIGGFLFFKEKFILRIWLCIIIGFIGVLLILHPTTISWYSVLPILSAIFFSASSLLIKTLSKYDSEQTILFYLLLFMSLFAAIINLYNYQNIWQSVTSYNCLKMIGIGFLYLITQLCMIKAYNIAMTSFLAPFKFARFPANVFVGLLIFQEIPTISVLIGGTVIFASYVYMFGIAKKV